MDGISEILGTYNCVSLDEKIQFELDGVVEKEIKQAYCIENLEFCVSCMDYTTLKVSDTEESVKNFTADLLKKLKKFNLRDVAAVCVFSNYAGIVREGLKGTEIQTAVVAGNFPNSQTFTEIKLAECKMAIKSIFCIDSPAQNSIYGLTSLRDWVWISTSRPGWMPAASSTL